MDHFRWALRNVDEISPDVCRQWAVANYSLAPIGRRYTEFFKMILDLREGGWYQDHPERDQLDWMKMDYSMLGGSK